MTQIRPVPRFEPEVIEAAARRHWRGNTEKVPTTSHRTITLWGIELSSRYGKADEVDVLQAAVATMPLHLRRLVRTLFCDSKEGSFVVEVWSCSSAVAREIGQHVATTFIAKMKGHSGVWVECNDVLLAEIAAESDIDPFDEP